MTVEPWEIAKLQALLADETQVQAVYDRTGLDLRQLYTEIAALIVGLQEQDTANRCLWARLWLLNDGDTALCLPPDMETP